MPAEATRRFRDAAQVLLAAQRVNDAAGAEEEQRFEEGVGHQMKYSGAESRHAAGHDHVSDLADGGVGQHALDVGLRDGDGGGIEGRYRADHRDCQHRLRRVHVEHRGARNDVDPGGNHGGGVNQRTDRCWTGHGVREPDV